MYPRLVVLRECEAWEYIRIFNAYNTRIIRVYANLQIFYVHARKVSDSEIPQTEVTIPLLSFFLFLTFYLYFSLSLLYPQNT